MYTYILNYLQTGRVKDIHLLLHKCQIAHVDIVLEVAEYTHL